MPRHQFRTAGNELAMRTKVPVSIFEPPKRTPPFVRQPSMREGRPVLGMPKFFAPNRKPFNLF